MTENKETTPPEAADVVAALTEANATLAAEAADLKDKLLRTLAEMENLRRRTEREIIDTKAYGIAAFARDIVAIADNMERARAAVPADATAGDPALKALVDGVDLTERELAKALDKQGVRRFDPTGEKFDPNRHQAMYEVPDATVPSGFVVQVMQAGYLIGERVLRPALVGVSKGGPKVAPGAAAAGAPAANENTADPLPRD